MSRHLVDNVSRQLRGSRLIGIYTAVVVTVILLFLWTMR